MGKCQVCGEVSPLISGKLGVCLGCIRRKPGQALEVAKVAHARSRAVYGLPPEPPRDKGGLPCGVCANNCIIGASGCGYCGLVWNVGGRLVRFGGTVERGILEWYYDGLPTNCVSWWFCPGCTGSGYPRYAYKPEPEYGYYNLAVFYGACSYDCLFCQNWHYRNLSVKHKPAMSAKVLAGKAFDQKVSCICYFGGDPSPQMPHSLETSRIVLKRAEEEKRILRVCWETNGYMNPHLAEKAAELALQSGGNIKFDLKAWSEPLAIALCGVSNKPSLENFKLIGEKYYAKRPELPVLTASTLLVPGYVDAEEVEKIAQFISQISPEIPYTLLAFYPCYVMNDLPTTSRKQAIECKKAAEKHLQKVRLGNIHLLS
ncbi:MAG: radical SAM protein [Candidatus Bathyarchaeia archaeon]|nr:radical SAM protein [Candidatus Bathyarchaeota archaeon]